jgi:tetratricopeptide (TPR) repeat protein
MRQKFYLIIFSILYLCSCKKSDFLNTKPDNSLIIPSTISDLQALLDNDFYMNGAGNTGIVPALGEIGSDNYYVTDINYLTNFSSDQRAKYIWATNPYPGISITDWDWPYRAVFYANAALENLKKIIPTNANQSSWNNVKGSAFFYRAFYFYQLAQVFAPVYNSSSEDIDLGIPLRLKSDINEKIQRASVKETYNQIITDLKNSIPLLPITPSYKTRPSKPAAYALLSRVFQTMEDYTNAFVYADSCLQLNSSLMNYNNDPDIIAGNFPFKRFNSEVLFQSTLVYSPSISPAFAFIDSSIYNSYATTDLRRTRFFKNLFGAPSFFGSYDGTGVPFSGLATDEVYLIRAECYARAGNKIAALADLNTLLAKRWDTTAGAFSQVNASDATEALSKILIERRKELIMRGLRWTDLRRLNKDPRFAVPTIKRLIQGITYTLSANSNFYTWPIPDDIISFNPTMVQNPR